MACRLKKENMLCFSKRKEFESEVKSDEPLRKEEINKSDTNNKQSSSSLLTAGDPVYLGFGKVGCLDDDVCHDESLYSNDQKASSDGHNLSESCIGDDVDEYMSGCDSIVQSGCKETKIGRMTSSVVGRPRYMRSTLCKQPRPLLSEARLDAIRPRGKKFSCAAPSTGHECHLLPSKPRSPRKISRARPAALRGQTRIEPGISMNPSQSMDVTGFRQQTSLPADDVLTGEASEGHMDNTQTRIKEFLDKACADAARSRTKLGPTISLSDLAAIDEQKTSMPILVEGILGPEERKRQVSKVYPMRTPSPHHIASSRLQGSTFGSRSTSRTSRGEHHARRVHSPLVLPPIVLPPIRENREFKARQSSWATVGEGSAGVRKLITEDDWKSLRKCRYLRIPDAPNDITFDVTANIDNIFK